jgi:hypothetical protein
MNDYDDKFLKQHNTRLKNADQHYSDTDIQDAIQVLSTEMKINYTFAKHLLKSYLNQTATNKQSVEILDSFFKDIKTEGKILEQSKHNTNLFEALNPYPWLQPLVEKEITGNVLANLTKAIEALEQVTSIPQSQRKPVIELLRMSATRLKNIVDKLGADSLGKE